MKNRIFLIAGFLLIVIMADAQRQSSGPKRFDKGVVSGIAEEADRLSEQCWRMREFNVDSALILGDEAIRLAEAYDLEAILAKACNYMGAIHSHHLLRFREAIPYFRRAHESSLIAGDTLQLGYAYNNLSFVYVAIGNTTLALQYGEAALEQFESIDHQVGLAYGLSIMGVVYRAMNDFPRALAYFKQASEIRNRVSPAARQGSVLYNVARTYEDWGKLDSAMQIYRRALEISEDSRYFNYGSQCLHGIGNIHYAYEEYDQALAYYGRALEWDQARGRTDGVIQHYIGMALVYAYGAEYEEGERLLNSALELAKEHHLDARIIHAYRAFSQYYNIRGDLAKLARSYETFLVEYDSILIAQQIEIVDELERNFQMNRNLTRAEEELETNSLLRARLIIIIVLMVVIMLVLIWEYRSHRRKNLRIREMNRTKDKILSVVSHDLRNPFHALIGFSNVLVDRLEEKDYEVAGVYAGYLKKASVEGLDLLNNLLNWASSQSGKIRFNPVDLDLNELLDGLQELFRSQADKHGIKLQMEHSVGPRFLADPDILKIILVNLVTNAFKYTEDHGRISVIAALEGGHVTVRVEDTGIGMSEALVDQLFDTTRFNESRRGLRNEKGTGLGISIVNELAGIHKGSVSVSSIEGKGSVFTFKFPFRPVG